MRTSARPRTLVLSMSDLVIDVAMLGPHGTELGPRQVVPITTETATLWNAIEQLGEFDRITLIGADRHELCARLVRQSQRPVRQMSRGALEWSRVITGAGVEVCLSLAPRFGAIVYAGGVELPGFDLGSQLVRKDRRLREYVAPRVLERKGPDAYLRRMTRAIDEILAVWKPTTLFIAAPEALPIPNVTDQVVVVPARTSLADAVGLWNDEAEQRVVRA